MHWVRLPSKWIKDGGLLEFKWRAGTGASETTALMLLVAISHRTQLENGIARITYDELIKATGVSRTKIASGLEILVERNLVKRGTNGRSTYELMNYGERDNWAKLPAKPLYNSNGIIPMFDSFYLRNPAELNALKIYLALAAGRNASENVTWITFDGINKYTGVHLSRIRTALNLLIIHELIFVDHSERADNLPGLANNYKLVHLLS